MTHSFPSRRSSYLPAVRRIRHAGVHAAGHGDVEGRIPVRPLGGRAILADRAPLFPDRADSDGGARGMDHLQRSEEHTSELQSLMRISYAVFCLKKKKKHKNAINTYEIIA